MQHIKENKRVIGDKSYWLTDDPNIVLELDTRSQEIYLDKINRNIEEISRDIIANQPRSYPKLATAELRECIDRDNSQKISLDSLNLEKEKLQSVLNKINGNHI